VYPVSQSLQKRLVVPSLSVKSMVDTSRPMVRN
jgi:hypothetical protein